MGEENGSTSAVVNIDLSGVIEKLDLLKISKNAIIRNIAITLYTNTNFDTTNKSPIQIADECIAKALIMAKALNDKNLLIDKNEEDKK